jgi:CDP-diacylglycerol--glycerol-3-phosphate 3-phosphatidyltransferase
MSIPNSLTVFRIILTPVFIILLFSESPISKELSLVIYIVAALTDWYDGWVARKYGYISRWGKFLDPLADKILSSAALFSFAYLSLVDLWMVWIIVIRDFAITILRSFAEYHDRPVVTSKTAQAKTFGEFIIIYYILILYVARNLPWFGAQYGPLFESLMHPKVLFGMMLLVTISSIGTGLMYIFDNRLFLREFYGRFIRSEKPL